jgi:hypothetical protein
MCKVGVFKILRTSLDMKTDLYLLAPICKLL